LPFSLCSEPVGLDGSALNGMGLIMADVVSEENRYHHDPDRLAQTLMRLQYDRHRLAQIAAEAAG